MKATGCARDEAAAVVALIRTEKKPTSLPGFLRKLGSDGELPDWLARVREERRGVRRSAAAAAARASGACPHGIDGGSYPNPETGLPWFCGQCRAAAKRTAA